MCVCVFVSKGSLYIYIYVYKNDYGKKLHHIRCSAEILRARAHLHPFWYLFMTFVAHHIPDHANIVLAEPILIHGFHGVPTKKALHLPVFK